MIGRVKKYEIKKGYGFLVGQDGKEILVHFSNIQMKGFKKLEIGQVVEYDIGKYGQNNTAINVKEIEGYKSGGMLVNTEIEHDVEDKGYWCNKGCNFEKEFVDKIVPKLAENIIINPEKKENPKAIDLKNIDLDLYADLKTQETPFFTAMKKYQCDPQYTVTFNYKDYEYYKNNYPNAIIYWWVNWRQLKFKSYEVSPLYGVWKTSFKSMKEKIESKQVPLHSYEHRIGDKVNATQSYLFNLKDFEQIL